MNAVIDVLASSEVDCLERLWGQLLVHHSREAAHLAALGAVRSPEDSCGDSTFNGCRSRSQPHWSPGMGISCSDMRSCAF